MTKIMDYHGTAGNDVIDQVKLNLADVVIFGEGGDDIDATAGDILLIEQVDRLSRLSEPDWDALKQALAAYLSFCTFNRRLWHFVWVGRVFERQGHFDISEESTVAALDRCPRSAFPTGNDQTIGSRWNSKQVIFPSGARGPSARMIENTVRITANGMS